jgi:DNA adenine methylase
LQSKPIIRWAGSKRKLLPRLIDNLPKGYNRYIEPFCGSACLFFEQPKGKAILADINSELINALKEIKINKGLRDQLIQLPNTADEYYRLRCIDPSPLSNTDKAIRFLYLNRFCFNGVYRTNLAGQFNVPRGTRTGGFPPQVAFDNARLKLKNAILKVSDYTATLEQSEESDFVYIDPPYAKSDKFTGEYGIGSFNATDIPKFIAILDSLDDRGVKFLFSYRACKDTQENLKERFHVDNIVVKRHISGFKTGWSEAEEILVKNYE